MILLVYVVPLVVLILTCLGSRFGGSARNFRWWFLRIALLPLIFSAFAIYIHWFPREIPVDWDPMTDPNYGRMDFASMIFWGMILPIAYFVAAAPIALAWALSRNAK